MLFRSSHLKILLFILLFCLGINGFALENYAEEIPIKIKADDLVYDHTSGIIIAKDNVKVIFKDMELRSNSARIDLNANIATLEGQVEIIRGSYEARALMVTYDISTEISVVFQVRSVFKPSEINRDLYVTSQKLIDYGDRQIGEESSATTCDYDEPHYHVRSKWFEYYPEDKLIGFSNTFYLGPAPVSWSPVFIFNLKKKRSPYNFVYGENRVEGKFLKTYFDYYINKDNSGILYVDSTEKKGPGYGIGHDYVFNNEQSGLLYLYLINEQDTGLSDYVLRLNHNIALDENSKISLSHRSTNMYQVPSGRLNETGSEFSYKYSDGKKRASYDYNVTDNKYTFLHSEAFSVTYGMDDSSSSFYYDNSRSLRDPKWDRMHEKFYHEQSFFSPDARIDISLNYYKNASNEAAVPDEKLEPLINLTYKGSFYSIKLTQNWYIDMDGSRYPADANYEYMERLPELSMSFNTINAGYFNLNSRAGIARYHEAKLVSGIMRHMTANRYYFGGDIDRTDNVGFGTSFRQSYGLDQYAYEPGDARYQLREDLRLDTNLWGFFRNNVDYNRGYSEGNTPFFFDNLGSSYSSIKEKMMFYCLDKVRFSAETGYNYQTSQYFDILTNLLVTPNEKFSMNVSTGYSIENKIYRDLVVSVTYVPFPKFSNSGGLVYDLNNGRPVSANSYIDMEIGETWQDRWHLRMGHTYDFFSNQFILRDLAIVKDLHCWEATYTYSDYMKEHRIGFTLKAFPEMPIGFNTGAQGSYFDGFYQNLNFGQSESPRRY